MSWKKATEAAKESVKTAHDAELMSDADYHIRLATVQALLAINEGLSAIDMSLRHGDYTINSNTRGF